MIGVIAEKPSQARNFALALFGSEKRMSGVYNGQNIVIVALRGHLYELSAPEKQVVGGGVLKSWNLALHPWNEQAFTWKFELSRDAKSVVDNAKKQLAGCSEIVIATDDDPGTHEGSGLAVEVLLNAKITAPKFSRMYFVDESVREVQKAFANRKTLPHDLSTWSEWQVAYFRNRWDYLSGLQETRIATVIGGGQSMLLRCGRLKTAMVAIVAKRLAEIDAYKPIPFFENRFRDECGNVYINPDEPCFKTKDEVPNVYHASDVVVDEKAMKRTAPPRLMDIAGVSAALAPQGISAERVLSLWQAMYQANVNGRGGYLSYPRSEDKTITPEQFDELAQNVDAIAQVVGIDPRILTHRSARKTHVKPQGAHGANRPGANVPPSLAYLDATFGAGAGAVYEMAAKSALAMFAQDYEYEYQAGHVKEYPAFKAVARVPRVDGWHAVLGRDLVDDVDEATAGLGCRAEPYVHEGVPPRPKRPTMKWLMKQLENRNVGTGATRTSTYAEVVKPGKTKTGKEKQLFVDKRGVISMAPAGERCAAITSNTHIASLDLTEHVFAQMADIERGALLAQAALAEIQQVVRDDMATMQENAAKLGVRIAPVPKDVERVEVIWKGKKQSFKRVWGANDRWDGHRFTDDEIAALAAGKSIAFTAVSKTGREYQAVGAFGFNTWKGKKYFGFQLDTSGWGQKRS